MKTLHPLALGAVTLFTLVAVAGCDEKTEQQKGAQALRKDVDKLIGTLDADSAKTAMMDTAPVARGEMGEVEGLIRRLINRTVAIRNAYTAEIDSIGLDSLLEPRWLANDRSLLKSREMLVKAHKIVTAYQERSHRAIDTLKNEINALNINEETRQEILAGYTSALADKGDDGPDGQWKLERRVLAELDAIVNLLASKKNGWTVSDNNILFTKAADLALYNTHLAALQAIIHEQEQRSLQNREQMQSGLSTLESK